MEWRNGLHGNNSPWSYSNYSAYNCPPGGIQQDNSMNPSADIGIPPPVGSLQQPHPPAWGAYPPGYGSYPYSAGSWTYEIPVPGVGVPQQPINTVTESSKEKQKDAAVLNPPLPPDPPPKEPPLPPKEVDNGKSPTSKLHLPRSLLLKSQVPLTQTSKSQELEIQKSPNSQLSMTQTQSSHLSITETSKSQLPQTQTSNSLQQTQTHKSLTPQMQKSQNSMTPSRLPPMLDFDLKAPPPPPPPEENIYGGQMQNAMNYNSNFQGGNWYNDSMLMNKDRNNYGVGMNSHMNSPNNLQQNAIKFNINSNRSFNSSQAKFDQRNNSQHNFNEDKNKYRGKKNNIGQQWANQIISNNFYDYKGNTSPKPDCSMPETGDNTKSTSVTDCSASVLSNGDWPITLKSYVGKCFARCVTEIDKDQVEICLKGKLTLAARNGSLWDKDWENEPLIGVYSANTGPANTKKSFPNKNMNNKTPTKPVIGGDPSRGFYVTKRSLSRSRSRSNSPDMRRRRDRKYSPENEERGFISFRGGRGGKGNKKNRGKKNANNEKRGQFFPKSVNSQDNNNQKKGGFFSKAGMTLEPDLCTTDHLNKRAARFANAQGGGRGGGACNKNMKRKKSMNINASINSAFTIDTNSDNMDWSSIHIIGTSTELEKLYLRLTSAPDPTTVRTVDTLRRSLEHIKKLWKTDHRYKFTCNQLKSIRQDLTVQGIRNEFTRDVYETHCRIALEQVDHEEFNQCQTQLKDLYSHIGGVHQLEFAAYRLLYYIYTSNTLDMTSMLAILSETAKKDPCVSFALKIRAAWSLGNYCQFFKLYRKAPKMTGFLVDWFIERERKKAIKVMVRSYRPGNLGVEYVKSTLAFSEEDWVKFVETIGLVFTDKTKNVLDCKASGIAFAAS